MFQGVLSEKTFYVKITIAPGDIDAKKVQKNLTETWDEKSFLNA